MNSVVAGGIHAIANNHELYDAALPQQPLGTMGAGLVRMGYYPLADIGVAFEADAGGSGNGTIYGVRGLLEAGWPIVTNRFDIAPFVVGGVGLIGVSGTPAGADSDMDYQWGLGLRLSASENVRLRFDFRHHPLAASGVDGRVEHVLGVGGRELPSGRHHQGRARARQHRGAALGVRRDAVAGRDRGRGLAAPGSKRR